MELKKVREKVMTLNVYKTKLLGHRLSSWHFSFHSRPSISCNWLVVENGAHQTWIMDRQNQWQKWNNFDWWCSRLQRIGSCPWVWHSSDTGPTIWCDHKARGLILILTPTVTLNYISLFKPIVSIMSLIPKFADKMTAQVGVWTYTTSAIFISKKITPNKNVHF